MTETYCILGGGGSFGIHTALYLLGKGHEVHGIGRNPLRPEPFTLGIERHPGYVYYQSHITNDYKELFVYLELHKPKYIINFAAQGEGAASWKESWRFFETNCVGLSRLVEWLMQVDWLDRFIQIGTSEMYGSVDAPADEDAPIRPTSPYAASKVAFDLYLQSVTRVGEFPYSIIRPSNCYCPGQLLHRIIPKAIWCGLTGNKLPLHGGGQASKSYMHARDLARAIYLLSRSGSATMGEIYNVAPRDPTSIREVVQHCANGLGMKFEDLCQVTDERPGQDSMYWLDNTKASVKLNWRPTIEWAQGIEEMVEWGHRYIKQIADWPTTYEVTP